MWQNEREGNIFECLSEKFTSISMPSVQSRTNDASKSRVNEQKSLNMAAIFITTIVMHVSLIDEAILA